VRVPTKGSKLRKPPKLLKMHRRRSEVPKPRGEIGDGSSGGSARLRSEDAVGLLAAPGVRARSAILSARTY
jgi:hypothetical protein